MRSSSGESLPCTVRLLPIGKPSMGFYDFDEYEQLVAAAQALDPNTYRRGRHAPTASHVDGVDGNRARRPRADAYVGIGEPASGEVRLRAMRFGGQPSRGLPTRSSRALAT
jgi:hypothetical protein